MKESRKKVVGTIKAKIGSVEIMTFLLFMSLLFMSIWQFFQNDFDTEWIYLIFFEVVLIVLLFFLVNFKLKTIVLTETSLEVKRPFGLFSRIYQKSELKGFDLQEFYDTSNGISRQIRIWTKEGKQIVLVRDAYANYPRAVKELKKFGLGFLGTVELKSKYKQSIAVITVIVGSLMTLMFATLAFVKALK